MADHVTIDTFIVCSYDSHDSSWLDCSLSYFERVLVRVLLVRLPI